jgi:hypothetical protein
MLISLLHGNGLYASLDRTGPSAPGVGGRSALAHRQLQKVAVRHSIAPFSLKNWVAVEGETLLTLFKTIRLISDKNALRRNGHASIGC